MHPNPLLTPGLCSYLLQRHFWFKCGWRPDSAACPSDLWRGQWCLLRLKKEWVAKKLVNGESKLWPLDFSASFNQKPFLFLAWERLWKSRPGHCWILCGGFLVRCTLQPLMSQPLAAQWCDNLWICLKIGSFIPSKLAISFPIEFWAYNDINWCKIGYQTHIFFSFFLEGDHRNIKVSFVRRTTTIWCRCHVVRGCASPACL